MASRLFSCPYMILGVVGRYLSSMMITSKGREYYEEGAVHQEFES